MNFAAPTALWWAALAVPVVIFYILKIRMRRVPVSTIMFWQQVFEEKQPRSLWQTLRHWLSLLLQLLFLLLLVGALTDPFFASEERNRRRLVVVVDNSASMRAGDVEPSRFGQATEAARGLIGSLRLGDEMAIVSAGTQPKVACGLTGHQKTLRDALAKVEATDGPTKVSEAVTLAERLLAGHENAKVVILSDGCFEGASELAKREDVVWQPIGTNAGNVAITQFQVRRSLLDPVGLQVLIEVRNLSDEAIETRLELTLDDDIVDVLPVSLEPDETWTRVLDQTTPDGGRLTAVIDHADALESDNSAVAILPERRRIPVVLVCEGNLFLERVFAANQLVDLRVVNQAPSSVDDGTILVFHRQTPETVPAGNVLFIDPTEGNDLWEAGEVLEQPIVASQNSEHALMAHVRLDNVIMPQARELQPTTEAVILATSATEDPLYFAVSRSTGNVLVLTVDLEQGDLPLRTAFPIMMTNALNWFTGDKGELREAVAAGEIARIDVSRLVRAADASETVSEESRVGVEEERPNGIEQTVETRREFVVTDPDGNQTLVATGGEEALIGPLNRCGVWTVTAEDATGLGESAGSTGAEATTPGVQVACNLSNPGESDLRGPDIEAVGMSQLRAGLGGKPIWFYLVLVAWALVATEWYLYQRRWIT